MKFFKPQKDELTMLVAVDKMTWLILEEKMPVCLINNIFWVAQNATDFHPGPVPLSRAGGAPSLCISVRIFLFLQQVCRINSVNLHFQAWFDAKTKWAEGFQEPRARTQFWSSSKFVRHPDSNPWRPFSFGLGSRLEQVTWDWFVC